jgi:sporulation protein YlmC with PRC-barrel domain
MTPSPEDLGAPGSYLSLDAGAPVFSSDGEELGRVEEVVADTATDVFDGLVVATGTLGGDLRFVEGAQVDEIYEGGVVLKLDAASADDLPPREQAAGER